MLRRIASRLARPPETPLGWAAWFLAVMLGTPSFVALFYWMVL